MWLADSLLTMDQMDVDQLSTSSLKRPASSSPVVSSSKQREENLLTDDEITRLKKTMASFTTAATPAEFDDFRWTGMLVTIWMVLGSLLQFTSRKDEFISPPAYPSIEDTVKGFSEEELKEWKLCVRNGIDNNDWNGLINHRMYISDYQIIQSH